MRHDEQTGDWFAVDRSIFTHPRLAGPYDRRSAWLWLIAHAAWKDHETRTRGGIIKLERGEVMVGRDHLAMAWGWTPKRVRNFLSELRREGMLEIGHRTGQYANVGRISNYDRFQRWDSDNGPATRPTKGQRGASEGPHRTKITKETIKEDAREDTIGARLDDALGDFNRAAEVVGFTRCATLSEARAKTLNRRLRDIGGGDIEVGCRRFREALSAIPHWPFLAGKMKANDGRKPFRLDLDRLLSTGSGLGDVLAKLCDLHEIEGPAVRSPNPSSFEADWAEAQAAELAEQHARFHDRDRGGDNEPVH